jgi:hypothetical protein
MQSEAWLRSGINGQGGVSNASESLSDCENSPDMDEESLAGPPFEENYGLISERESHILKHQLQTRAVRVLRSDMTTIYFKGMVASI